MSLSRKIYLISVLFFLCSAVQAQALWRGTVYGMSQEEVAKIIPEASPVGENRDRLNSGAEELLRIIGVEIVNERFTASFFFKDQKLVQVMLSLNEPKTFSASMRVFDGLAEALRAKYGPELSRRVSREPFPNADATWLSGKTNIGITLMAVVENHVRLNVNYQIRVAREAEKL